MEHSHRLGRTIAFLSITNILLISFSISFFLKLRIVVRRNENNLNIQFFCFKCKKLTHHKAEER